MRRIHIGILSFLFIGLVSCDNDHDMGGDHEGDPIYFDFSIVDEKSGTRASLGTGKVIYVTSDGETYYKYTYDDSDSRWECNSSDNKLTWTGNSMQLFAIARNDENEPIDKVEVLANQKDNGYESSDFLACGGTYSYTSGTLKMTLEHKVAKVYVKVTNCLDASKMTCETMSASMPLTGSVAISGSDVVISPLTTSVGSVKLFCTNYDTSANTAEFVAYVIPQDGFDGKFEIKCGSSLIYHNSGTSINLKAGKTTEIDIALAGIQQEYTFYPVNKEGGTYLPSDKVYEGQYQVFTAPCTGKYKLEVYGAQGGSYTSESNIYGDECYLGDQMFSPYDIAKNADKKCKGGKGAYVTGVVNLSKNDKLYIYVGKQASTKLNHEIARNIKPVEYNQYQEQSDHTWKEVTLSYTPIFHEMDGGWNGGGTSVAATLKAVAVDTKEDVTATTVAGVTTEHADITINGVRPKYAGGGGGATDISVKAGEWDSEDHLYSRIIVAGGGGGGCYYPREQGYYDGGIGGGGLFLGTSTWTGGNADGYPDARGLGGTLNGTPTPSSKAVHEITANLYVNAATYTNAYPTIPHPLEAAFGYGGSADWGGEGLGAGGGGWYGGSYGTGGYSNGGGGGGSSWAYTQEASYNSRQLYLYHPYYYDNSKPAPPDQKYMLTKVANLGGVNEGDGWARITLLAE